MEASNLDVLLRRFLEVIAKVFGAHAGHLFLLRDSAKSWTLHASTAHAASVHTVNERASEAWLIRALSSRILLGAKSGNRYLLDPGWKGLYDSVWSFPLMRHGKIQGVMQLGFDHPRLWLPREEQLVAAATERCMAAAEKARLVENLAVREQQIRQLAEHMLHVEERERRRISRELHDEAGQSLICIRLQLELLEMSLDPQSDVVKRLTEVRDLTEHTILEMRRLIADLSPVVLEQFGLESALRQLVKRFQSYQACKVSFKTHLRKRLPPQLEIVAYRIIQECFNNISKHSEASNVNISLSSADGVLRLVVSDNGIGFHVESALAQKDSFGLAGIRERVALLGGHFLIESRQSPGEKGARGQKRGTSLRIEVPIPSQTER
jgi:signal transduction histidine kinase